MSTERNEEHKDVEEYFNRVSKKSFVFSSFPPPIIIETTARVVEDEPDGYGNSIIENVARSLALFNKMQHFVETGKVEE